MLWLHRRPSPPKPFALSDRQSDLILRQQPALQMLSHVESNADTILVVAHDERHLQHRVPFIDTVPPSQLHVRHQQPMATLSAYSGLKRHKHSGRSPSARNAFAVHELNPGNHPPPQPHVLRQRPLWQQRRDSLPKGPVVAIAEPRGAVDGLEFDKGQEGGDARVAENMVHYNKVEGVVHSRMGRTTMTTRVRLHFS